MKMPKSGGKMISKKKPMMAAKSMYSIGKPSVGKMSSKGKMAGGATSGRKGANIKFNQKK